MSGERLTVGPERVEVDLGGEKRTLPLATFARADGKPRTHHPRCPTYPGAPLDDHSICCDCIDGEMAERKAKERR